MGGPASGGIGGGTRAGGGPGGGANVLPEGPGAAQEGPSAQGSGAPWDCDDDDGGDRMSGALTWFWILITEIRGHDKCFAYTVISR